MIRTTGVQLKATIQDLGVPGSGPFGLESLKRRRCQGRRKQLVANKAQRLVMYALPVVGREKQGPRLEDHCFYVREVGVQAKSGGKTVTIFKWGSEGF